LKLVSDPIDIPDDATAQLKMTFAAINKGHSANQNAIKQAMDSAATAYSQSTDASSSNLITTIVNGFKTLADWIASDCDTALYHGTEIWDGHTLATSGPGGYKLGNPPNIAPVGTRMWWTVYDRDNIPSPCNIGHYNQVVWVAQV